MMIALDFFGWRASLSFVTPLTLTSAGCLNKENIVISDYRFRREGPRTKAHQPRHRSSASIKTVGREHEMLAQSKTCKRKKFPLEEVEEYWGDVGWLATVVHHAEFPGLEKPKARRQRVNVGRRNDGNTSGGEHAPNIPEERNRTLQMFDNFDGGNESKGVKSKNRREIGLI